MLESMNQQPFILGFDLGGTKLLTAIVDAAGYIVSRHQVPTPQGVDAVVKAMAESANQVIAEARLTDAEVDAIGIGVAGPSSPESGIVFTSPHLPGWQDVPLRDIIARDLGRPAFLINDARAAALGELYYGAAKGMRHFIYVTISTGIGGGIVIDGKLYLGATGTAGEIGHMTIQADGPLCNCGNHGCWESLASGSALARAAAQRIKDGDKSAIIDIAGDVTKITAETVQRAAEQDDALAQELIARTGYYFGTGLANLINIFNPQMIVIGGGLANMGDMLLQPAFKAAGERAFKAPYQAVRFARAALGGDSGVLGAAAFARAALEKLENHPHS
ncbi:MAG: ROK family protein [Dehalococcoidales bacterium]|nr:ROK family protein [Dehalococcoidales bacterium]